jgi:hypothetical protein
MTMTSRPQGSKDGLPGMASPADNGLGSADPGAARRGPGEAALLTERILPVSIVVAAGALAAGYSLDGLWVAAPAIVCLGILWLAGHWRGWKWTAPLGLAGCTLLAAGGLWFNLGKGWMLVGLVAALAAWDLDYFLQRLRSVAQVKGAPDLERHHLFRLLVVVSLGLLLPVLALQVQVRLSLGVLMLLGLVAVLGLSQALRFLGREID